MIERVGFFHFVEAYEDPIGQLAGCLGEKLASGRTGESLIVLPEGFNLGRKYNVDSRCGDQTKKKNPMFAAHCTLQILSGVAKARSLVFVVGLIDVDSIDGSKRNCAYFVDGISPPKLLCSKMNEDHSGEYEPCEVDCPCNNPLEVGDLHIGALLCIDAEWQSETDDRVKRAANDRRRDLLSKLGRENPGVLCVPGAFCTERSWENLPDLSGKGVVVANSIANRASTVVDNHGAVVHVVRKSTNEVFLVEIGRVIGPGRGIPKPRTSSLPNSRRTRQREDRRPLGSDPPRSVTG